MYKVWYGKANRIILVFVHSYLPMSMLKILNESQWQLQQIIALTSIITIIISHIMS